MKRTYALAIALLAAVAAFTSCRNSGSNAYTDFEGYKLVCTYSYTADSIKTAYEPCDIESLEELDADGKVVCIMQFDKTNGKTWIISTQDFTYDDAGNVVNEHWFKNAMDSSAVLRDIEKYDFGALASGKESAYDYTYADGRLIQKVFTDQSSSSTTNYIYEGDKLVREETASDTVTYEYPNGFREIKTYSYGLTEKYDSTGRTVYRGWQTGQSLFEYCDTTSLNLNENEEGEITEFTLLTKDSEGNIVSTLRFINADKLDVSSLVDLARKVLAGKASAADLLEQTKTLVKENNARRSSIWTNEYSYEKDADGAIVKTVNNACCYSNLTGSKFDETASCTVTEKVVLSK